MAVASEDDVKRKLKIDSWRGLSKEKMLEFVAIMPELDNEVAKKIVEQFPDFGKFAAAAITTLRGIQDGIVDANDRSREDLHRSFAATREALQEQLRRNDLTPEQRDRLVDQLISVLRLEVEKDSEQKRFLLDVLRAILTAVVLVGVIAVAVATGGKVRLGRLAK